MRKEDERRGRREGEGRGGGCHERCLISMQGFFLGLLKSREQFFGSKSSIYLLGDVTTSHL